jgi:hypothetical protein
MLEPAETEDKETLDAFAEAWLAVACEADEDKERVLGAPLTTPIGCIDEARAARKPDLRWRPDTRGQTVEQASCTTGRLIVGLWQERAMTQTCAPRHGLVTMGACPTERSAGPTLPRHVVVTGARRWDVADTAVDHADGPAIGAQAGDPVAIRFAVEARVT